MPVAQFGILWDVKILSILNQHSTDDKIKANSVELDEANSLRVRGKLLQNQLNLSEKEDSASDENSS